MSWNPGEVLRLVDSLHRDKNIDSEYVFQAIESALVSAARKQYGEESEIVITIDRDAGTLKGSCNGEEIDPEVIGRIGAQTAKQVIIQKIREAERDSLVDEFEEQIGQMVSGVVQRAEGGATTVALGPVEAILPRSEQIPGESHHANERVRAIVYEVRPQGNRVKVVLSRNHPSLVARLFEQEIPEIADGVITVNAMAREPGYRSKVAVSSSDTRVDCVGACVGVRGNRIKNIVDELSGERIDIVRWSDDPEVLIPNSLQPAEVEQVLLCDMIGRAIVLVREDQLSLAIGRRGQNVRLASKLSGWDIEIMTADELEEQIERAVTGFCELEGMTEELAQSLVEQGYLSYDDLEVIEPDALQEMGGLTDEQVELIVNQAEERARQAEVVAAEERRQRKIEKIEEEMRAAAAADAQQTASPPSETDAATEAKEDPEEDGDANAT
ncbi:MAG: transcription termination factor NusA [Planctomycetaceae bacterium]|nr:transcription termination factor NusA [Planctomycetales bacterium]MCB9924044.1 transcription termination factor NusA [Planctomycetaceae bacterium]